MDLDALRQGIPDGRVLSWTAASTNFLHDLSTGRTFRYPTSKNSSTSIQQTIPSNGLDPFPNIKLWCNGRSVEIPIYAYRGHLVVGPPMGRAATCPTCVIVRLLAADPARQPLGAVWADQNRHFSKWFEKMVTKFDAYSKVDELKVRDRVAYAISFAENSQWSEIEFLQLPGCPEHQLNSTAESLGLA